MDENIYNSQNEDTQLDLKSDGIEKGAMKKRTVGRRVVVIIVAIVGLAGLVGGGFFLGRSTKKLEPQNQQTVQQENTQQSAISGDYKADDDAIVKNFEMYKTFGGKFAVPTKSVTYSVHFPKKFGFDMQKDRLQLIYGTSVSEKIAADSGEQSNENCKVVADGTQCDITWNFDETTLEESEYFLKFKVLDNTTHVKGRVYMPIQSDMYTETGSIFLKKPLTTPYVVMSISEEPIVISDNMAKENALIMVTVNAGIAIDTMVLGIDQESYGTESNVVEVDDSNYSGGRRRDYEFVLPFNALAALSKGEHTLSITAKGANFTVPAVSYDQKTSFVIRVE